MTPKLIFMFGLIACILSNFTALVAAAMRGWRVFRYAYFVALAEIVAAIAYLQFAPAGGHGSEGEAIEMSFAFLLILAVPASILVGLFAGLMRLIPMRRA